MCGENCRLGESRRAGCFYFSRSVLEVGRFRLPGTALRSSGSLVTPNPHVSQKTRDMGHPWGEDYHGQFPPLSIRAILFVCNSGVVVLRW